MAMKATLRPTTIREVIENFVDNHEEGVRGLNGALYRFYSRSIED